MCVCVCMINKKGFMVKSFHQHIYSEKKKKKILRLQPLESIQPFVSSFLTDNSKVDINNRGDKRSPKERKNPMATVKTNKSISLRLKKNISRFQPFSLCWVWVYIIILTHSKST